MLIDDHVKTHSNIVNKEALLKLKVEFDNFFSNQTAYINLKENNKLLVYNSDLSIKDVIDAMIQEDIYCGLIWNTEMSKFSGIFTVRDCLIALFYCFGKVKQLKEWTSSKEAAAQIFQKNDFQLEELDVIMEINFNEEEEDPKEDIKSQNFNSLTNNILLSHSQPSNFIFSDKNMQSLQTYLDIFQYITLNDYLNDLNNFAFHNNIISIDLDSQLKDAVKLMQKYSIHRIVVEDTKNSVFVGFITYETIFSYFISNYYNYDMDFFLIDYKYLGLDKRSLICCFENQSIFDAFFKIWENKISVLPILQKDMKGDSEANVLGYLFLKDLLYFLTHGEKFKATDTIKTFLTEFYSDIPEKPLGKDRLVFIKENEELNFKEILELIYFSPEKKIVITKENDECSLLGIITLTDLFSVIFPQFQ